MGNEMVVQSAFSRIADIPAFAVQLGRAMALSGTFGLQNEEQGFVMALTCIAENMTPLEFCRTYHIIQGKPSMRADRMLAEFRTKHKGTHRIVQDDVNGVVIKFTLGQEELTESLTWEECQQEDWPWVSKNDHKRGYKDNWSTPRGRRNMMFCRVVSSALRHLCPEIVAGTYTPEEMEDVFYNQVSAAKPGSVYTLEQKLEAEGVIEGTAEPVPALPAPAPEPAPPALDAADQFRATAESMGVMLQEKEKAIREATKGNITEQTLVDIRDLFDLCNVNVRAQENALKTRNVTALEELNEEQGQEMAARLRLLHGEQQKKLRGSSKS